MVRLDSEQAWGTLAFVSNSPRSLAFGAFDLDVIQLMAQWVGAEIARQEAEEKLRSKIAQQRRFVREMLSSVTEGKLRLCDSSGDLPNPLPSASRGFALAPSTLRPLRKQVEEVASDLGLATERIQDLVTAVGEASMNAVKHGGGGIGQIFSDSKRRTIQVWIQDGGEGIRDEDLHRATLEKGWSGAGSFGHGFFLMLRTVDRTYLLTGAEGTTIVLEQEFTAPQPTWLR